MGVTYVTGHLGHQIQSANILHSVRQWLIFKIGYVCQIPQEGGGRACLANSLFRQ